MPILRLPVTITDARAGKCVNVWHVRTAENSPVGDAALGSAVTALRAFYAGIADQMPPGNPINADFAVDVQTGEDHAVSFTQVGTTGVGGSAPPHLSVVIGWKTTIRGRRARGRTFLGPMSGACLEADGTPLDACLTKVRTAATTLVNASLADNAWGICIWGQELAMPKADAAARAAAPHVGRDITGYAVQNSWGVIRSRRPRV